jgi:hypothetical protein
MLTICNVIYGPRSPALDASAASGRPLEEHGNALVRLAVVVVGRYDGVVVAIAVKSPAVLTEPPK